MSKPESSSVTGNVGRRRVAEHRATYARLDVSLPVSVDQTISELADDNCAGKAEVVRMLIRYALTNRDWKAQGMLWGLTDL